MNTNDYDFLPPLNKKDFKEIQKQFDEELKNYRENHSDFKSLEIEDQEIFLASIHYCFYLAKRMAKKKFTPKKYRYWELDKKVIT